MLIIIVDDMLHQLELCRNRLLELLSNQFNHTSIVLFQHKPNQAINEVCHLLHKIIQANQKNQSEDVICLMDHHLSTVNNQPIKGAFIIEEFYKSYPNCLIKVFLHSDDAHNLSTQEIWKDIKHAGAIPKGFSDLSTEELFSENLCYDDFNDIYTTGLIEFRNHVSAQILSEHVAAAKIGI